MKKSYELVERELKDQIESNEVSKKLFFCEMTPQLLAILKRQTKKLHKPQKRAHLFSDQSSGSDEEVDMWCHIDDNKDDIFDDTDNMDEKDDTFDDIDINIDEKDDIFATPTVPKEKTPPPQKSVLPAKKTGPSLFDSWSSDDDSLFGSSSKTDHLPKTAWRPISCLVNKPILSKADPLSTQKKRSLFDSSSSNSDFFGLTPPEIPDIVPGPTLDESTLYPLVFQEPPRALDCLYFANKSHAVASPDGSCFAVIHDAADPRLELWKVSPNSANVQLAKSLTPPSEFYGIEPTPSLLISNDNRKFAYFHGGALFADNFFFELDMTADQVLATNSTKEAVDTPKLMAYSPNNQFVMAHTGSKFYSFSPLTQCFHKIKVLAERGTYATSRFGDKIAVATGEGVKIIDLRTLEPQASWLNDRGTYKMAFSPDASILVSLTGPNRSLALTVRNTSTGQLISEFQLSSILDLVSLNQAKLVISPDSRHLALLSISFLAAWDLPTGTLLFRYFFRTAKFQTFGEHSLAFLGPEKLLCTLNFTAIFTFDPYKAQKRLLLLLAREKTPASVWFKGYLPFDIFRLLFQYSALQ